MGSVIPQGVEVFASTVSGALAGALCVAVLHPIDVVKIRYQVGKCMNTSYYESFKTIYREEGKLNGLYRGCGVNILASTLAWSIYFFCYSNLKKINSNPNTERSNLTVHLLSSMESGSISCILVNPLWLLKTRMCTQGTGDDGYKGIMDGFRVIYKKEGIRGFYKGLVFSLIGASHGAIQFMAYEEMKVFYNRRFRSEQKENIRLGGYDSDPPFLAYFLCAAASKSVAMIATYPLQVLKCRQQDKRINLDAAVDEKKSASALNTIKQVYSTYGIRGFYRGLTLNILRSLPGSCITLVSYEVFSLFLKKLYLYAKG